MNNSTMQPLQDVAIVGNIFNENATAIELLQLVVCISFFWVVFFFLIGMVLRPRIKGHPWMAAAASRDYDHGGKELYENLGCPVTKEEFISRFEDQWPWLMGVLLQHMIGGALCIPAVLNIGSSHLQASLACLGVLSEMGWELEDMVGWVYQRWFTSGGKVKVPLGLVIMLAVHHSLTITLGLPMVLNYRDNHFLHWLTFDLQCAGAVALFTSEYCKFLDVSDPKQLRQFQVLTGVTLVIMIITRGFHWVYLCCQLILTWYQEKAWGFLVVGTFCSISFSGFNWFFCIEPFYKRFVKFMKLSKEYQSLPASADAKTRRASLISLQGAAANFNDDWRSELAELLEPNIRSGDKSNRRDTMPANMFGTAGSRLRSSSILFRSSTGNISVALKQFQMAQEELKED